MDHYTPGTIITADNGKDVWVVNFLEARGDDHFAGTKILGGGKLMHVGGTAWPKAGTDILEPSDVLTLKPSQAVIFISINGGEIIEAHPLNPRTNIDLKRQTLKLLKEVYADYGITDFSLDTPSQGGPHYAAIYTEDHLDQTEFAGPAELATYLHEEAPVTAWESGDFYFTLS